MKRMRMSVWVFVLLALAGCATSGDLQKVENRLLTLQTEFETVRNKQNRLLADTTKIRNDLNKMNDIFSSFQKKGRYNFANLGVKMDELRTLHQQLLGQFQALKAEYDKEKEKYDKLYKAYASRFGDPTATAGQPGQVTIQVVSPKIAFDSAKALYDAGKYREARGHLKQFIQKNPTHDLTDRAYLLLGDCYFQLRKYFDAIIWYHDARKKFSKGSNVDLSLLKLGEAHYKMGACPEGRAFLRRLLRRFRSSPHASKARRLLRGVRRFCKKSS